MFAPYPHTLMFVIKIVYYIFKAMGGLSCFRYTTLVYGVLSVFNQAQSCHGLENNGTQSRRFLPGFYADGPLCAIGQTIYIRGSHYVAFVTVNDTNISNHTTMEKNECHEFVSDVHNNLIFTCENRMACDDTMIPVYEMTCERYKLHADYFHVSYDCLETDKPMQFSLVCRDKCQEAIDCKDNAIIIKDLLLGYKTRGKMCLSELEADDCLVHYNSVRFGRKGFLAQHDFIDRCNSRSSCNITAAEFHTWNITCGTELRNSSNDYFLAIYECDIVPHRRTICNEDEINISCSSGNVIRITSAWFTFVPENQNCLGDDNNLLKRCSIKEWTDAYYRSLLLHCQNKTSCDRGLMAKSAPIPGTCFNGQFTTQENRTTDAVIIEYSCIPAIYLLKDENAEETLPGFTYLLVGIILAVILLVVAAAIIARLRLVRRESDIQRETKETKRKSERYYEQIDVVEKTPHDKPRQQQPIYAEPIFQYADNSRSSMQYSDNVYSEILPRKEDSKDDASPGVFSEAVYAKVNKSPCRYDELELYDNQLYKSSERAGTAKR